MRVLAVGKFELSRNFLTTLAQSGVEVSYGFLGHPCMPAAHLRLRTFPLPRKAWTAVVREELDASPPDLLYVGSAGYDGSNALAMDLLEAGLDVPIVRVYKEFRTQPSEVERDVLIGVDGVVLHSQAVADYFAAIYGLPADRVFLFDHDVVPDAYLPSGVDVPRLSEVDGEPHVVLGGTMKNDGSGYDYRAFITGLAERGVHVHVHPAAFSRWLSPGRAVDTASTSVERDYEEIWRLPYVHREDLVPIEMLTTAFARYDAGLMQARAESFVPELTPWLQMDHPSKHSYYLAAGLPIAIDVHTLHSLRADLTGFGVVLPYRDLDGLAANLRDPRVLGAARTDLAAQRHRFRLGARLPELLSFLEGIASRSAVGVGGVNV